MKNISFVLLIIFNLLSVSLVAQEVEHESQVRASVELSKKLFKHLRVEFSPELRWDDNMKLDRILLSGGLKYKVFDFLSVSAYYRYIQNKRENKATEHLNRYQFNATFSKEISRWEPGFRLSYTNFADEDEDAEFLRYKAFVAYNIRDCKLTPSAAIEMFHELGGGQIHKYRYKLGLEYKIAKHLKINAAYKLDYYMNEYRNRHIADISLKYSF